MKNKKYYLFLIFVLVIAFSAILISCSNNETILFENNLNSAFLAEGTTLTEYQIAYLGLDGATVDNNPTSYNEETETFTLNNPTKTGYTFLGWSGTDIVDKSTSVEIAKGSTGDKEYTANWKIITYTIVYSGLDGVDSITNPDSYNVNTETFTLNNPTKIGYNFLGWSGTGIDDKSTSVQIAKGSIGNREYTANWELTSYDIIYVGVDGADNQNNSANYSYESDTITLQDPTKTGYEFLGWTTTEITTPTKSLTISQYSTGVKTFTANWEIITYTIVYSGLEGADSVTNPESYNVDTETFTLNNPTKTGYIFLGWSVTGIDEKSTSVQIAKGSTGNREYTANWEVASYGII